MEYVESESLDQPVRPHQDLRRPLTVSLVSINTSATAKVLTHRVTCALAVRM